MIVQYLSQTNENATVAKFKNFSHSNGHNPLDRNHRYVSVLRRLPVVGGRGLRKPRFARPGRRTPTLKFSWVALPMPCRWLLVKTSVRPCLPVHLLLAWHTTRSERGSPSVLVPSIPIGLGLVRLSLPVNTILHSNNACLCASPSISRAQQLSFPRCGHERKSGRRGWRNQNLEDTEAPAAASNIRRPRCTKRPCCFASPSRYAFPPVCSKQLLAIEDACMT